MRRLLLAATILVAATSAHATMANVTKYPGDDFIRPTIRIKGCIAIVDKVRDGTISPTEWMEQNKEDFADLQAELQERNYKPETARLMLMGLAITLCMGRKVPHYQNTCVTARDPEKRDVQMMKTAHIPECWNKEDKEEHGNGNGGGGNSTIPCEPWNPACQPRPPVNPWDFLRSALPPSISPDDRQQFETDLSFFARPFNFIGGGNPDRFYECASYWQSLHHNRPPQVRQILYAVRVARCMVAHARGAGYAIQPAQCPIEFASFLQPHCYARVT